MPENNLAVNPKDIHGASKVSITKLPASAIIHAARAMMNGAEKYGPYNWRDKNVIASIYIDAAMRHLMQWFEGEQESADSHVHHLGHAIASIAVLLDAEENGNLNDDRPKSQGATVALLERLNTELKKEKDNG